ncbi:hypothetical protein ES319_D06G128200v1 [Gossypium barbadense]|uniref:Amino acid permease/ SLC12A domain-containing protein n=1 Tax=Gossypium barbadense TaxID=3634 RepID=A0A5J5R2S4_GOSBA|nr:hypothetical protein ES319_D06G128200v1 [Gossypium barbadense]
MGDSNYSQQLLDHQETLPTTKAASASQNHKKLSIIPFIFLIYFEVSGGAYGAEAAVGAAGPLCSILGFLIFPFLWSIPEALITAELATTFPGNGGYVIWAHQAFGPFWGLLIGSWKFVSGVINLASCSVLCIEYIKLVLPLFSCGASRYFAVVSLALVLSFLNYTGLVVVGYTAILLAGEVDRPQKTFPKALFLAGLLTCLAYLVPLLAATGAMPLKQENWVNGYFADVAQIIAGKWLMIFLESGAVLSSIGFYEAQLTSCAYQLLGMADLGVLPQCFSVRSKWFNTPWLGILVSTLITVAVSSMNFADLISSINFLYSLAMLLEFASFLWLRRKLPMMERPFRVPLELPGLTMMCLIPSGFLVYIMSLANGTVLLVSSVVSALTILWYFMTNHFCKSNMWTHFNNVGPKLMDQDLE